MAYTIYVSQYVQVNSWCGWFYKTSLKLEDGKYITGIKSDTIYVKLDDGWNNNNFGCALVSGDGKTYISLTDGMSRAQSGGSTTSSFKINAEQTDSGSASYFPVSGLPLKGQEIWFAIWDTTAYNSGHREYGHIYLDNLRANPTFEVTTAYDTTKCTEVSNVTIAPSSTYPGGTAKVRWSAGSGGVNNAFSSYTLWYQDTTSSTYNESGTWTEVGGITGTEYTTSAPAKGYNRFFCIQTRGAAGSAWYSGYVYAGPLKSEVANCKAPTNIKISPSPVTMSGAVTVSWTAGADDAKNNARTGYIVEYKDADTTTRPADDNSWVRVAPKTNVPAPGATATTQASTGHATNGKYRHFRVRATGAAGDSYYSSWAYGYVQSKIGNCAAPKNLKVSATIVKQGGTVDLSWEAGAGSTNNAFDKYVVKYQDRDQNSYVESGTWSDVSTPTATKCTGAGVNAGQGKYRFFRVCTAGKAGPTYNSGWIYSTGVRTNNPPNVPKNQYVRLSTATGNPGGDIVFESEKLYVTWGAPDASTSAVDHYEVYCRTGTTKANCQAATWSKVNGNTTSAIEHSPSLERGSYIQYGIRTVDKLGDVSDFVATNYAQKNPGVSKPRNPQVSKTLWESGDVTLSWTEPASGAANVASYQVRSSVDGGKTWTAVNNSISGLSLTVTPSGMKRGGKISYQIQATDNKGVASGYVAFNDITYNSLPTVPTNLAVNKTRLGADTTVRVSWTASTDANSSPGNLSGYELQCSISSDGKTWGNWTNVDVSIASTATYYDHITNLARGKYVRYRIQAKDALGAASGYTKDSSAPVVYRNQLPIAPTFVYPGSSIATLTPAICISYSADPDKDTQTLSLVAKQSSTVKWTAVSKNVGQTAGTAWFRTSALTAGTYTFVATISDQYETATTEFTLTISAQTWTRTIAAGDTIANESISHQADLNEMETAVNAKRTAYGLAAINLGGSSVRNHWGKWKSMMEKLANAAIEAWKKTGDDTKKAPTIPNHPGASGAADAINAIRTLIGEV